LARPGYAAIKLILLMMDFGVIYINAILEINLQVSFLTPLVFAIFYRKSAAVLGLIVEKSSPCKLVILFIFMSLKYWRCSLFDQICPRGYQNLLITQLFIPS